MFAITITLPAFAKINLSLRVLGKRADGYHEIDTVLQTVSLHDTITFEVTDRRRDHGSGATIGRFLLMKPISSGARRMRCGNATRTKNGASRFVWKNGFRHKPDLGGGSSDAAVDAVGVGAFVANRNLQQMSWQ